MWPLSRESHPKPFLPLPDGDTLIAKTFNRAASIPGAVEIITVTNREFHFLTADVYDAAPDRDMPQTFLLEPMGRDTASAIALAVLHAERDFGHDAILLVLPADHLISDEEAFRAAVERAATAAGNGKIVTFGITPDRPETGFGYIEAEQGEVRRFVEKPDLETAQGYLDSGNFFWNSGMFCFSAGAMHDAMKQHCPEVIEAVVPAYENARLMQSPNRKVLEIDKEAFEKAPAISIDYAVMERASSVACIPTDCGWSDIGSWAAVSALWEADENGNRVSGDAVLDNTSNCFVHSQNRLSALVGVSDLVVVDTADALLICGADATQDVKRVYSRLKETGHPAAGMHQTAHRPWGSYTVLEEGEGFKIKRIEVKPGGRLSLQSHYHRSEHWVVVSGAARITNGAEVQVLTTNQSTYIPCGMVHRLENPGILPLILIEVQSGAYLGEDDIVRLEDNYGRA